MRRGDQDPSRPEKTGAQRVGGAQESPSLPWLPDDVLQPVLPLSVIFPRGGTGHLGANPLRGEIFHSLLPRQLGLLSSQTQVLLTLPSLLPFSCCQPVHPGALAQGYCQRTGGLGPLFSCSRFPGAGTTAVIGEGALMSPACVLVRGKLTEGGPGLEQRAHPGAQVRTRRSRLAVPVPPQKLAPELSALSKASPNGSGWADVNLPDLDRKQQRGEEVLVPSHRPGQVWHPTHHGRRDPQKERGSRDTVEPQKSFLELFRGHMRCSRPREHLPSPLPPRLFSSLFIIF